VGVPNVNYIRAEIVEDFPIWASHHAIGVPIANSVRPDIIDDS